VQDVRIDLLYRLTRSNVPTAMMMPETYCNVFGYTTNPHNTRLSSGGSSGGESSLLALRGAWLLWGRMHDLRQEPRSA